MKLINLETQRAVQTGDELKTGKGDTVIVADPVGQPLQHSASTGRIYVQPTNSTFQTSYFPNVCNCKWMHEDDIPYTDDIPF